MIINIPFPTFKNYLHHDIQSFYMFLFAILNVTNITSIIHTLNYI